MPATGHDRGAGDRQAPRLVEVNRGWGPPDEDELAEWLADGVCRCPDGCLVRPDGGVGTGWRRGRSSSGRWTTSPCPAATREAWAHGARHGKGPVGHPAGGPLQLSILPRRWSSSTPVRPVPPSSQRIPRVRSGIAFRNDSCCGPRWMITRWQHSAVLIRHRVARMVTGRGRSPLEAAVRVQTGPPHSTAIYRRSRAPLVRRCRSRRPGLGDGVSLPPRRAARSSGRVGRAQPGRRRPHGDGCSGRASPPEMGASGAGGLGRGLGGLRHPGWGPVRLAGLIRFGPAMRVYSPGGAREGSAARRPMDARLARGSPSESRSTILNRHHRGARRVTRGQPMCRCEHFRTAAGRRQEARHRHLCALGPGTNGPLV